MKLRRKTKKNLGISTNLSGKAQIVKKMRKREKKAESRGNKKEKIKQYQGAL